jgi:hypothetical protein
VRHTEGADFLDAPFAPSDGAGVGLSSGEFGEVGAVGEPVTDRGVRDGAGLGPHGG